MDPKLIKEAESLGINYSLYYLMPPKQRDKALRADIDKEKARRRDEGE